VFSFVSEMNDPAQAGCFARPSADDVAMKAIVADIAALRDKLALGQLGTDKVSTSGVPLGVHPGLADSTTAPKVREEMKAILQKHLFGRNLNAMAIVGPQPWIFLAMQAVPPNVIPMLMTGGFVSVPGPTLDGHQLGQMFNPAGTTPRVSPAPVTNNLNQATCLNAALPGSFPVTVRNGLSTSTLFNSTLPPPEQIVAILDLISDPAKSHFFNTDCVSCHTETRRAMSLSGVQADPRIETAVLPTDDWNVRNFGWSPFGGATVTRRTAAETAAVVAFINAGLLDK
jgi:hypothetical protein